MLDAGGLRGGVVGIGTGMGLGWCGRAGVRLVGRDACQSSTIAGPNQSTAIGNAYRQTNPIWQLTRGCRSIHPSIHLATTRIECSRWPVSPVLPRCHLHHRGGLLRQTSMRWSNGLLRAECTLRASKLLACATTFKPCCRVLRQLGHLRSNPLPPLVQPVGSSPSNPGPRRSPRVSKTYQPARPDTRVPPSTRLLSLRRNGRERLDVRAIIVSLLLVPYYRILGRVLLPCITLTLTQTQTQTQTQTRTLAWDPTLP